MVVEVVDTNSSTSVFVALVAIVAIAIVAYFAWQFMQNKPATSSNPAGINVNVGGGTSTAPSGY